MANPSSGGPAPTQSEAPPQPRAWTKEHCTLQHGCILAAGHAGACDFADQEDEYEVEAILDERAGKRGSKEYLIKWRGWPIEDATWEGTAALTGCKAILREWKAKQQPPPKQPSAAKRAPQKRARTKLAAAADAAPSAAVTAAAPPIAVTAATPPLAAPSAEAPTDALTAAADKAAPAANDDDVPPADDEAAPAPKRSRTSKGKACATFFGTPPASEAPAAGAPTLPTTAQPSSAASASASAAAERLLEAQRERLPGILAQIEAAGPDEFYKDDHWAWYGKAVGRSHPRYHPPDALRLMRHAPHPLCAQSGRRQWKASRTRGGRRASMATTRGRCWRATRRASCGPRSSTG